MTETTVEEIKVLMYGRVSEDKDSGRLFLDGPFFGGEFTDDDQLRDKIRELIKEYKNGTIISKVYLKDLGPVNIHDMASKHFDRLYEEFAATRETKKPQKDPEPIPDEWERMERRLSRCKLLLHDALEQVAEEHISHQRRAELQKSISELQDNIEITTKILKAHRANLL